MQRYKAEALFCKFSLPYRNTSGKNREKIMGSRENSRENKNS